MRHPPHPPITGYAVDVCKFKPDFLHCHRVARAVRLAAVQNGHDMDMRDEMKGASARCARPFFFAVRKVPTSELVIKYKRVRDATFRAV